MGEQVRLALQESLHRAIFKVANLLPGILALVVALIVSTLIGWLLATILRRILIALDFDARVEKSGIAKPSDWASARTPTFVATRLIFWVTVIIGLFVGIVAFDASLSTGLSSFVVEYISKLVSAVVLLIIGVIVARFFSRSVLINGVNMNMQHARLLSLGVKWLVLVFTAAMVLDHLGIARQIVDLGFGILFGGIVLALALAVGLGSRDLVSRSLENRSLEKERVTPPEEEILRHF